MAQRSKAGPLPATSRVRMHTHRWLDAYTSLVVVVESQLDEKVILGAYGRGPRGTLPLVASPQSRLLDWFDDGRSRRHQPPG